jgi:excisionase family DNA binding protein
VQLNNPQAKAPSPFMTRAEAADYLRCSVDKIDAEIARGRIRRLKFGRQTLLRREEITNLVCPSN